MNQSITLSLPSLPPLELSGGYGEWQGSISLPLWGSFSLKSGYLGGRHTEYSLLFTYNDALPVAESNSRVSPTKEQIAAYVYLIENEKAVLDALLQAVLDNYPQWKEDYGGDEERMPEVTSPEQLQSLIILWTVTINFEAKDGYAYVGLGLITEWDIEHGMGAVLHKDRVVSVGDHDSVWDAMKIDVKASQNEE